MLSVYLVTVTMDVMVGRRLKVLCIKCSSSNNSNGRNGGA